MRRRDCEIPQALNVSLYHEHAREQVESPWHGTNACRTMPCDLTHTVTAKSGHGVTLTEAAYKSGSRARGRGELIAAGSFHVK